MVRLVSFATLIFYFLLLSDANAPNRETKSGPSHLDTTKSPVARSSSGRERSPDVRDNCSGRDRRTAAIASTSTSSSSTISQHPRGAASTSRLTDDGPSVSLIGFNHLLYWVD